MKIIIYDDKSSIKEFKTLVNIIPLNISVSEACDLEIFLDYYNKEKYDAVFININKNNAILLKNKIVKNNPSQRIISINNSLECSDSLGCEHCKESTNSYRIFKPFQIDSLVKSFKNIKCTVNYCDETLTTKLLILSKAFDDLMFDEKTYKFTAKNNYKNSIFSHSTSLMNLIESLNQNKINFKIEDDFVQILK